MPTPPPPGKKKKPAVGIELLLEGEEPMGDDAAADEEIDLAEDDLDADMAEEDELGEGADPFAAESEEDDLAAEPSVDPEQAALAEKLGFTDPEQQQALIDLIQLVLSNDSGGAPADKESGALPPLPESIY